MNANRLGDFILTLNTKRKKKRLRRTSLEKNVIRCEISTISNLSKGLFKGMQLSNLNGSFFGLD